MKKLLTFVFGLIACAVQAQVKNNTFHVVDKQTNKPVASATIAILRASLSITTEKDGIFSIPGDLSIMKDTVVISAQRYIAFKLPLANLGNLDTIKMQQQPIIIADASLTISTDTLLNNYNRFDVGNYVGLHMGKGEFNYLQIAQKFDAKRAGTLLKKIDIERLAFHFDKFKPLPDKGTSILNGQYEYTELEHTKFRLRVYDVSPLTGGPGKDLCDKIIEVKSREDNLLSINLKSYNIVIPNKTFFVAVEWMRDYMNMGYVHVGNNYGTKKLIQIIARRLACLQLKGLL
ncbi:hypothetical protein [Mucilaginibacter antarcticus]|uniref:hypothetical protein n=1 Tax=Mucilaginibacter antarcticus TaxID=1855725 RepID=UPI00363F4C85